MCGILGVVQNMPIERKFFESKILKLTHRGPDHIETMFFHNDQVALGHSRLSIIDLNVTGHQPMCNEDQTIWVTYNGEIYNYIELRNKLISNGHSFKSNSDTEVLIHGYEEWGINGLVDRIEGMFAFGIWDSNKQKLLAARDRLGIKPFYFLFENSTFSFASEIKALNFKKEIDHNSFADFLVYRFVPSPQSIYKNIKKLEPGTILEYDKNLSELKIQKYWEPNRFINNLKPNDFKEEIEFLIRSSIRDTFHSDVDVAVFLSGGYDSTAILNFMPSEIKNVSTFSVGFNNWKRSEHLDARIVSQNFNTNHNELIFDNNISENMNEVAHVFDEPLGGSSFLAVQQLTKFTSKSHKVAIGGDGGDEIFGGYRWYQKILAQKSLDLISLLTGKKYLLKKYHQLMSWSDYSYGELKTLLNFSFDQDDDLWIYKKFDSPNFSNLKRLQNLDLCTFLPEVINSKVDRTSMYNSLEVRVPFQNHILVEKMLSLDESLYFKNGVNKILINQFLKGIVPDSILNKKKQGFSVPISQKHNFNFLLNGSLVKHGLINKKPLEELIHYKNMKKLWPLEILENWHNTWMIDK
jgi:asparagine synthase (glutamine-hydrolysing)